MDGSIILDENYKGEIIIQGVFRKAKSENSITRFFLPFHKKNFVLNLRDKFLTYGEVDKQKDARKKIDLDSIIRVKIDQISSGKWKYSLRIITNTRDYILLCKEKQTYEAFCEGFKALYSANLKHYLFQDLSDQISKKSFLKVQNFNKGDLKEEQIKPKNIGFKKKIIMDRDQIPAKTPKITSPIKSLSTKSLVPNPSKPNFNRASSARGLLEIGTSEIGSSELAQTIFESPRSLNTGDDEEIEGLRRERLSFFRAKKLEIFGETLQPEDGKENIVIIDLTEENYSDKKMRLGANEMNSVPKSYEDKLPTIFKKH